MIPEAFLRNMTDPNGMNNRPGDNDYKQFRLPPFIVTERMYSNMDGTVDENTERAFTIANKATNAIERGDVRMAEKMGYHALSLDPNCVDAWRILCYCLNKNCDGDTVVCALREVIQFAQKFYSNVFEGEVGMFYSIATTRPYMRLLMDAASLAIQSEQLDVSIYVYEEVIRLNHSDNMGARNQLLACYMKIIGRRLTYPKSKPVRTIEHAEKLINCRFEEREDPLFEDNNINIRWARILFEYARRNDKGHNDSTWKNMAKAEYARNDIMFKLVFGELDISQLRPASSQYPQGFVVGNKSEDARQHGKYLLDALREWPDFLIDLRRLILGPSSVRDKTIIEDIRSNAPNPSWELTREYKEQMLSVGNNFLEKGREALTNRNYISACQNFTLAKRGYYEAAMPSRRWYLHAPFPIVSNRCTVAVTLEMWNLARIDTRYTLLMNPEHNRSYLNLPKLAEAFKARQLEEEFKSIASDVAENKEKKSQGEWRELAKIAIGLLSIDALVLAATGKLTAEQREEIIRRGIENMYAPINVGSDVHPTLPWLAEDDMEVEV